MPFGPQTPGSAGSSVFGVGGYQCTRMRLTRQVIVDAQNSNPRAQTVSAVQRESGRDGASTLSGPISSSSEMWDMTTIGEGSFKLFVSEIFFPQPLSIFERAPFLTRSYTLLDSFFPPSDASDCFLSTFSACVPDYGSLLIHDALCAADLVLTRLCSPHSFGACGFVGCIIRCVAAGRLEPWIGLDHFLRRDTRLEWSQGFWVQSRRVNRQGESLDPLTLGVCS